MVTNSNPINAGRENYYIERALEKYYTESAEERGQWFGKCATFLGLHGEVTTEAFRNLFHGFSPDGQTPLVQNAGHPNRCMGWDLTFSPPKSVSVLWALAPQEIRAEILRAHQRAVTQTLTQLEDTLAVSRSGKAGAVHERAGLAIVVQQHYTSRTNDPQIHSHSVIINVGVRADGSTGALHSINWFRAKKALDAAYQARLASELQKTLGVSIEAKKDSIDSFHISGVPEEICDVFSKRRHKIEQVLKERGESGPVAAQKVALETRPKKQNVPLDKLFGNWSKEADVHGWSVEHAAKLIQAAREQKVKNESAREQAVAPAAASAASQPKDQGIMHAQAQSRSPTADGPHASKPVESTKAVQFPKDKVEAQQQPARPEKPKADSMKTAEAQPTTSSQAATDDTSQTTQPPARKRKQAQTRGKQSASIDEKAKPRDAAYESHDKDGHKQSSAWRIEWLDGSGASGRRQKDPFRYLIEGLTDKIDRIDQQDTHAANLKNASILTLMAPRSVNVLWAFSSEAVRKTIEEAHHAAADSALRLVESNMRVLRRDEQGVIKVQGNLAATSADHRTIRFDTPLLRTKTTLNFEALRPQGVAESLQSTDIVMGKRAVRLLYEVELAAELRHRLGVSIEAGRKGFHVAGLPQDLCKRFALRCDAVSKYVRDDPIRDERKSPKRPAWFRRLSRESLAKVAEASTKEERQSALWNTVGESLGWSAARTEELFGKPRERRQAPRAFINAFENAKRRIFPEKETGRLLSWVATKLAIEQGVGANDLVHTLQKIRPAAERSLIHIEWRPLSRKAPFWSPVKNLKIPVIAIGKRPRRWDKILWRKAALLAEIRVQKRRLFPRAPKWSPLHDLKLPTVRLTRKSLAQWYSEHSRKNEQQLSH